MEKKYYLPNSLSIIPGTILIIFGLSFWITAPIDGSLINTLIDLVKNFDAFEIAFLIIGFFIIALGILLLKNTGRMLRAKLDHKGFYYLHFDGRHMWPRIPRQFKRIFKPEAELDFIAYKDIKHVEFIDSRWVPGQIHIIKQDNISPILLALSGLKRSDLQEIEREIKAKIIQK